MEMVEGVLMKEMGFVDEEDGEEALFGELLDVGADGIEDIASRVVSAGKAKSDAELTVEVAAAEGDVVAIGQSEAVGAEGVTKSAEQAGFASAGLAGEEATLLAVHSVDEVVEHRLLGGGKPEIGVVDLLGEGVG
jgi:hypothetical protein